MKVLIVCSYRDFRPDGINLFIKEQVNAICSLNVEANYYLVHGKGVIGYLKEIKQLRKAIKDYMPDVIHAHYGLCGLLANLATRKIPIVTTYHGSDINKPKARKYSKLAIVLSAWNIFVSQRTMDIAHCSGRKNCSLIPCGVDLTEDQLVAREDARNVLGWNLKDKKVLFAGMYMDDVKGPDLAKAAIALLDDVELIELKGYTRAEVNRLMCAVDCLLMTSKTEGSPQVIKEALACGCPIVSTDVGDVAERVANLEGCFIVKSRDPKEVAEAIVKSFAFKGKTKGREKIIADGLSNELVATRILKIYNTLLNRKL